jgi:hypothetical protein
MPARRASSRSLIIVLIILILILSICFCAGGGYLLFMDVLEGLRAETDATTALG